jgi:hypothetical protein
MTTVTIQLAPGTEEKLREKASLRGKSLESYIQELIQEEALATNGTAPGLAATRLSVAELDRSLDELSADLPSLPRLPSSLSRADIYGQHD